MHRDCWIVLYSRIGSDRGAGAELGERLDLDPPLVQAVCARAQLACHAPIECLVPAQLRCVLDYEVGCRRLLRVRLGERPRRVDRAGTVLILRCA